MLVLSRKLDEKIYIGKQVEVVVLKIEGNKVRLGIVAPGHVQVDRGERRQFARQMELIKL